ncbi:MAG: hypothetical protein WAV41_05100 [Microgenomates group bacterium]
MPTKIFATVEHPLTHVPISLTNEMGNLPKALDECFNFLMIDGDPNMAATLGKLRSLVVRTTELDAEGRKIGKIVLK